jgi:hypothetical protein
MVQYRWLCEVVTIYNAGEFYIVMRVKTIPITKQLYFYTLSFNPRS